MLPWRILDLISMSFIKNTECNRCSILSREPLRRMCVQSEGWIIWSCTWNWLTWIDSRTEFEELCIVRSTTKCPLNKLIQTSPLPVTPSGPAKTVTISKVPLTVTTSFLVIRLVWGRKWCHCSYSVSLWPVLQVQTRHKRRGCVNPPRGQRELGGGMHSTLYNGYVRCMPLDSRTVLPIESGLTSVMALLYPDDYVT